MENEPKETSFYREAPNPGPKTGPRGDVGKGTPSSRLKAIAPTDRPFRVFVLSILRAGTSRDKAYLDATQWLANKKPVKRKVHSGPYGKGCW